VLLVEAKDVTRIIDEDLASHPNFYNSHGVDLATCRVQPERRVFKVTFGTQPQLELWLVLEEIPGNRGGYLIAYDERCGEFGLAVQSSPLPTFLGYYGSFTETLSGM
jgi:hypothetical protein